MDGEVYSLTALEHLPVVKTIFKTRVMPLNNRLNHAISFQYIEYINIEKWGPDVDIYLEKAP